MYWTRKFRRRRTLQKITAYTCDSYYGRGPGLGGCFYPTIKEYFDAHGGTTDCEYMKVEIRIVRVPISPEERLEFDRLYEEKREQNP